METRWSLVLRAGGKPTQVSREALDLLCRAYRGPILACARSREADPERANDLVQGFFLHLFEGDVLGAVKPTRGRFREFLRKVFHNYATNVYHAANAMKRDGGAHFITTDPDELANGTPSQDQHYDRLWARAVLDRAFARLTDEQARIGKGTHLAALREQLAGDGGGESQHEIAAKLGMTDGAVRVELYRLRLRFAELVRAEVAETVAQPEDVDVELRHLCAALRYEE